MSVGTESAANPPGCLPGCVLRNLENRLLITRSAEKVSGTFFTYNFPDLRHILDEAFEIFGDKSQYVVAAPQYRTVAKRRWVGRTRTYAPK